MPPDGMSGGGKLQAYLRGIEQRVGKQPHTRVGFLEGSTEGDGTSMPAVAAENEFGNPAKKQPPRPFFRQMIAKHKGEWSKQLGAKLIATNYDAMKALAGMGEVMAGELQQSITDLMTPVLADSTILQKGGGTLAKLAKARARARALGIAGPDKPLIDTGDMLKGVAHEEGDG